MLDNNFFFNPVDSIIADEIMTVSYNEGREDWKPLL